MPGEILVRLADAADALAIWRLNRSCFGYEFPREQAVRQVEHIGPVSYTHLDVYKRQANRAD